MIHSPLKIKMMLHFYAIAEPYGRYDPEHGESQGVQKLKCALKLEGLIERDELSGSGYKATEKGCAWVEMICNTPYPVAKWAAP